MEKRDFLPASGFLRLRQKPLHLTEDEPVLFRGQGRASRVHDTACHVVHAPRLVRLEGCNSTPTGSVQGRGVVGRQNAGRDVEEGEAGVGEGRAPRSCDVRYGHSPSWKWGKLASTVRNSRLWSPQETSQDALHGSRQQRTPQI